MEAGRPTAGCQGRTQSHAALPALRRLRSVGIPLQRTTSPEDPMLRRLTVAAALLPLAPLVTACRTVVPVPSPAQYGSTKCGRAETVAACSASSCLVHARSTGGWAHPGRRVRGARHCRGCPARADALDHRSQNQSRVVAGEPAPESPLGHDLPGGTLLASR